MSKTISKTKFNNSFTIIVYKDEDVWVAHNLDFDIVGVDKEKNKAIEEMRQLTTSQLKFAIETGMLSSLARPAPARFWQMVSEKRAEEFKERLIGHHVSVAELDTIVKDTPILEVKPPSCAETRQSEKTA